MTRGIGSHVHNSHKMTEWRDISEAPKDKLVLLFEPYKKRRYSLTSNARIMVGRYCQFYLEHNWFSAPGDYRLKPTHFMPLPEPPK